MRDALIVLASAGMVLVLGLRAWLWWLRQRYESAIDQGVRLSDEWHAHGGAGW